MAKNICSKIISLMFVLLSGAQTAKAQDCPWVDIYLPSSPTDHLVIVEHYPAPQKKRQNPQLSQTTSSMPQKHSFRAPGNLALSHLPESQRVLPDTALASLVMSQGVKTLPAATLDSFVKTAEHPEEIYGKEDQPQNTIYNSIESGLDAWSRAGLTTGAHPDLPKVSSFRTWQGSMEWPEMPR